MQSGWFSSFFTALVTQQVDEMQQNILLIYVAYTVYL